MKPAGSYFGVVFVFTTFALVLYYTGYVSLGPVVQRERALTFLGFLPDRVLFSHMLFRYMKIAVVLGLACWIFHFALPFSAWLTFAAFSVLMCQTIESAYYTVHIYHIAYVSLLVVTFWYTLEYRELRRFRTAAQLYNAQYPEWLFFVPFFYLVVTYSYSGIIKLTRNGFGWINGTSLQLWVLMIGDSQSLATKLMVSSRTVALLVQISTLVFESTAFLTLWFRRLRPAYGVALIGMHLGVEMIFGFSFWGNIAMDFLLLVIYPLLGQSTQLSNFDPSRLEVAN
ncbi:MAG TPA: hypothetical protein VI231_00585 [Candidatus Binatia bacterium]|jgi:hypothetical protein